MSNPPIDPQDAFVAHMIQQLTKHGFPERVVAFPIERLYEAAAAKGLSFNRVLEELEARGIAHEKTPEKVIFRTSAHQEAQRAAPGGFPGIDPAMLAGMSQEQILAAAQAAMQQMSPEQLEAVRAMVGNLTPEQQAEMMEQAKKLGLF